MAILLTVLYFLAPAIQLVAWAIALVFAVRLVRRGGGVPERLFLADVCLMLAAAIVSAAIAGGYTWLTLWLQHLGYNVLTRATITAGVYVISPLISAVGITFVVRAFWRTSHQQPPH